MSLILDIPSSVSSAAARNKVVAGSAVAPNSRHAADMFNIKRDYQKALRSDSESKAAASVRPDAGRDRTDADAQIGMPLHSDTFIKRLIQLNPNLWFEQANADPEKIGIYLLVPPDAVYLEGKKFLFGFHKGVMPEFTLQEKNPDYQTLDGETFTGGCKRIIRQGYRTILMRLVRMKLICLPQVEVIFGPPSHDSAFWACLTGGRSTL